MHERKHRMAQLADFFVALPGGIGTLEEVIEIFTWLQLGLHLKPVGLLNVGGFYDPLLQFLDHMRDEQFLTPAHRAMLTVEPDSEYCSIASLRSSTRYPKACTWDHLTTKLRRAICDRYPFSGRRLVASSLDC